MAYARMRAAMALALAAAFFAQPLAPVPARAQTPDGGVTLWDGGIGALENPSNFSYGSFAGSAAQSSEIFTAKPDRWHAAYLNIQGAPMYRHDISSYDEIDLAVKTGTPGASFSFSVYGWPYTSKVVDAAPFVEGGALGPDYRLVRIPLAALKTPLYDLSSIEGFYFSDPEPSSASPEFDVERISAVRTSPTRVTGAVPLSEHTVKLAVADRYDPSAVLDLANYSLESATDPDFASLVHPVKIGRSSQVMGFLSGGAGGVYGNPNAPEFESDIFLVFGKSMKNGNAYTLTVRDVRSAMGVDFASPQVLAISMDDAALANGSVQVNQVGFLPDAPKYAYLGNYLGDAGAMELSPGSCEVRDAASGAVAFRAAPEFRGADPVLSGESVWSCDFSGLTVPGTYYVYAPGVGRSYDFQIGAGVYDGVYRKLARFYYYERAGTDLPAAYAGKWARKGGHVTTDARAVIHPSNLSSPLYDGEPAGGTLDESRGWYDAGDYGKYVLTAAPALFNLFTAYELFPGKFPDGANGIPESGNGVPDILDEAKWETDWLRNMQAPDGGVYDRVVTMNWAEAMPADDTAVRYVAPKTTHTTAVYAAALAMAYREFLPYFPDYAKDLLARAEKAWRFLEAHPNPEPPGGFVRPPGIGGGDYVAGEGDADMRAWAAAELYKSTGERQYDDAFLKLWPLEPPMYGDNNFVHFQKEASWAYATTKFPTDPSVIAAYKKTYGEYAATLVAETDGNPYRGGYRADVPVWLGWGGYSQSAKVSWELIKAYFLLGSRDYLRAAEVNLDAELGANPLARSFITGVGSAPPLHPLNMPSLLGGYGAPVPGIAVYGVHDAMTHDNPFYVAAQSHDNLFPHGDGEHDPYPALRRYYDIAGLVPMSEYSIGDTAPILAAFAYFSSGNAPGASPAPSPAPGSGLPPAPISEPLPARNSAREPSAARASTAAPEQGAEMARAYPEPQPGWAAPAPEGGWSRFASWWASVWRGIADGIVSFFR